MSRLVLFAALVAVLLTAIPSASSTSSFADLVDRYFADYAARNPSWATSIGFHQYDSKLEDYSRAAVMADLASKKRFLAEFNQIDDRHLGPTERTDRALVIHSIEAAILETESIRTWARSPDRYSSGISASVFDLMSRRFAPAEERLRDLISREKQMPSVLQAARSNLDNPPRIFTEIALEQLLGIVRFFEKDVPIAFHDVTDATLLSQLKVSNDAVIDALKQYQDWLRRELLPRSGGDFRIGEENFRRKLRYEEMVDIPLDRLEEIGIADLRRNQRRFKEVAEQLNAKADPRAVLALLAKDHPKPSDLLQSFRDVLGGLRAFIDSRQIVDIPSRVPPVLEETPPFARALTLASMDTPGPYETAATEAYFNVTLPEPEWAPQRVEEHMAGFSHPTIVSTAIHEAYPGHYVQFLWLKQAPSKVRKLLGANTNAEGWAHYCEQMMLDEGYGNGDPKLRLGQVVDALLRDARCIVGLRMHRGRMTFDQAVDFFVREGYQTRAIGLLETKRGTTDPTYLFYTLGKLEILKLRDDYRKARGAAFRLREFHNAFLRQGFPPIPIVRRALLGMDTRVL